MSSTSTSQFDVAFASNFEPLSLLRHLGQEIKKRTSSAPKLVRSNFEGLEQMLAKVAHRHVQASRVVAIVEWADLDPRLGLRSEFPLSRQILDNITEEARSTAERLAAVLESLGPSAVLVLPTLPLPPFFPSRPCQVSQWQVALRAVIAKLAERAVAARVALLDPDVLRVALSERASARNDLRFGFPYSESHARDLSEHIAELIVPPMRRKGLVVDLDGTLWKGIVGDDGASAVAWSLESGSMVHGLLQRMVGLLADNGVLVGVVTKNEPEAAEDGLARGDLIVPREALWPVVAGWEQKSVGVRRTASAWNIGVEHVAVVDDSALELAEINSAVPGVLTLHFTPDDPNSVYRLLQQLRSEFGVARTSEEDTLRVASARSQAELASVAQADEASYEAFLGGLEPELRLERLTQRTTARALELVNKTNQFNLNGERITIANETHFLSEGETYIVHYADRLARLGIIAVLRLEQSEESITVSHWVLSCRAFARRIEHALMQFVAERANRRSIRLLVIPTSKNAPLIRFLAEFVGETPAGSVELRGDHALSCLPEVRPLAVLASPEER